jgi:hypothetical protein
MPKQVRVIRTPDTLGAVNHDLGPNEAEVNMNARGGIKSFQFDGQTYTLGPEEVKTVPDVVATSWVAADAEVAITEDGF